MLRSLKTPAVSDNVRPECGEVTLADSQAVRLRPLSGWVLPVLVVAMWGAASCGKKVAVPNVKTQLLDQATKALTDAGLKVGKVTDASGATATAGKVVTESPDAGQTVPAGSAVNLGVEQPITLPNLVDNNAVDALVALQNLGLNASVTKQLTLNPIKAGKVLQQNPSGNTSVYRGDTVNLVVASPPDLGLLTPLLTQQPGYNKLSPESRKLIDGLLK